MRIFIGLNDTASLASDLKNEFSNKGINSYVAIINESKVTANSVDEIICKNDNLKKLSFLPSKIRQPIYYSFRRYFLLKKMAKECDVFIYIWQPFYSDARDLAFLKSIGKKIVVIFMGSEQRWKHAYGQEMQTFNIPSYYPPEYDVNLKKLDLKLAYLRNAEKYADIIYSLPNQSQLSLRPYSHLYIPVDIKKITENKEQREIPVILHAPTSRVTKGTDIILNALQKLKEDGVKFELQLLENVSHFQFLQKITDSDIVIDQIFIPSGGKFAREALAAGKVVLSSIRKEYIDDVPTECPIIDVNPDNLYAELKSIIPDFKRRKELAEKGRSFVKKYHTIEGFCDDILKKLDAKNADNNYDFYPKFFRNEFVPESEEHIQLYNKWTKYVADTDWYQKYIQEGDRSGLIF